MVSSLDAAYSRDSPGRQKMSGLVFLLPVHSNISQGGTVVSQNAKTPRTQERKKKSILHQRPIVMEAALAAVGAGKRSGACKNPALREGIRCRIKGPSTSSHCQEDMVDLALKNLAGPDPAPESKLHSSSLSKKFLLLHQALLSQCLG